MARSTRPSRPARPGDRRRPSRPARPRPPRVRRGRLLDVEIRQLGVQGDGIAEAEVGRVYVPGALPGERVRVALAGKRGDGYAAEPVELLAEAPDRREPPCPHFAECGGCSVQHVAEQSYRSWKRTLLTNALAQRGLVAGEVLAMVESGPATRRRAGFSVLRTASDTVLGFRSRESDRIVDLATCLVVRPEIERAIPILRELVAFLLEPGSGGDLDVATFEEGLDILLVADVDWTVERRERVARVARETGIARFSWFARDGEDVEPVVVDPWPTIAFGPIRVAPPPGTFLQPTAEGEAALADFVADALAGCERIADLYAGCGTFALRLAAAGHRVRAVEGDGDALAALDRAADAAGLADRITAEVRDLVRRPLMPAETEGLDAVLLDPPRGGARAQAEALAGSTVRRVVYVSCSPASFARDARTLVDAGFRLERVQPVDQFPWTGHLELAALLVRP